MTGKESISEISVDELVKIIQDAAETATESYSTNKIEDAVRKTIKVETLDILTKFGIDTEKPFIMQGRMLFIDKQMKGSEQLTMWAKRSAVAIFITAAIATMWIGFIQKIKIGS